MPVMKVSKRGGSELEDNPLWGEIHKMVVEREEAHIRQGEVAHKMGVCQPYVSEMERGRQKMTQRFLDRYRDALDLLLETTGSTRL